ncbi:hypothetical protein PAXRUDRAFT_588327 [Paxillus rubicundulus Ve08.2h10]|uniref:Uncharacterized protein n=1 Tax=Paxillus rubicundulus Ve08.2h10 TaxID=930991 RepID=A0A0D0DTW3_9AGAM|nr:hypothetical protein PAXRUDRAFT_588327 [Paxillus rubicundulus Ve08.2h10]
MKPKSESSSGIVVYQVVSSTPWKYRCARILPNQPAPSIGPSTKKRDIDDVGCTDDTECPRTPRCLESFSDALGMARLGGDDMGCFIGLILGQGMGGGSYLVVRTPYDDRGGSRHFSSSLRQPNGTETCLPT